MPYIKTETFIITYFYFVHFQGRFLYLNAVIHRASMLLKREGRLKYASHCLTLKMPTCLGM